MAFARKWANPTGTRTYFAWRSMKSRCFNSDNPSFSNYGGRGISVCTAWVESYDRFFEDMGAAPPGKSLDRIDFNKGYEPGNCRWAGWDVQSTNKRTSRVIEFKGEKRTLSQWAEIMGLETGTLHRRLLRMPLERALVSGLLRAWSHGTRHGYERGCRCAQCKASHAARGRELRAKRKARELAGNQAAGPQAARKAG